MIITRNASHLTFGTDATAQNVRNFLTAAHPSFSYRTGEQSNRPTVIDLPELYPSLFVTKAERTEQIGRIARAAVVRVSVLGTAAAMMLAIFHH